MKKDEERSCGRDAVHGTPPIEWAVAGLGAAVVAGTIGAMIWFGFHHVDSPPDLHFEVERVSGSDARYLVEFVARNDGDRTAAALNVVGELVDGGERVVQSSEATLDFVPGHSTRQGGLVFSADPSQHTLRISAKGFASP